MNALLRPVILSGGAGKRLWPLSVPRSPKQFLKLAGEKSLLRQTLERLNGVQNLLPPDIICSQKHAWLVKEQLRDLELGERLFLEPMGRNTAPAIALEAFQAVQEGDPLLLVLPSDHVIRDPAKLVLAISDAAELAKEGWLCTFGIAPRSPETGYGYILRNRPVLKGFQVERFVEKPDLEHAKLYLADGRYSWNSGMFLFRASRFLEELNRFAPEVFLTCREAFEKLSSEAGVFSIPAGLFARCPSISVDYAVMEKTSYAAVVELEAGWSDLGSFDAIDELHQNDRDQNQNVIVGRGFVRKGNDNFLYSDRRLVALTDVDHLLVIDTPEALCIARKGQSQQIKELVEDLARLHLLPSDDFWKEIDSEDSIVLSKACLLPDQKISVETTEDPAQIYVLSGQIEQLQTKKRWQKGESFSLQPGEMIEISAVEKAPAVLLKTVFKQRIE